MSPTISITAIASISTLGNNPKTIWEKYHDNDHCFVNRFLDHKNTLVAQLDQHSTESIEMLRQSDTKYKALDKTVLYGIVASREAVHRAGWSTNDIFGINIGSSRGATELFEKHFQDYLETGKTPTLASPTTTLGNISSWIAHDLQSKGPEISHSITCSTSLHALLNGVAWLRAGMVDKFLVGGSEAPLTDFTIAQMRALKIYSNSKEAFPCRTLDFSKSQNTLILGEAAAVCCIETGRKENALAYIEGIGYATEILEHNTSISAEATCFQQSMTMALKDINLSDVDIIVMHAPGTKAGDITEYKAIQKLFTTSDLDSNQNHTVLPLLTSNKWKIGHSFGASGMMSIEMAILMLQYQYFIGVPFLPIQKTKKEIRKILVNSVGFGGNAVSILLSL